MHADLHRRNWKVQENHRDSKIIIYDFGICFHSVSSEKNKTVWGGYKRDRFTEN